MRHRPRNVSCLWPKADMTEDNSDVCFSPAPESDHARSHRQIFVPGAASSAPLRFIYEREKHSVIRSR